MAPPRSLAGAAIAATAAAIVLSCNLSLFPHLIVSSSRFPTSTSPPSRTCPSHRLVLQAQMRSSGRAGPRGGGLTGSRCRKGRCRAPRQSAGPAGEVAAVRRFEFSRAPTCISFRVGPYHQARAAESLFRFLACSRWGGHWVSRSLAPTRRGRPRPPPQHLTRWRQLALSSPASPLGADCHRFCSHFSRFVVFNQFLE
jgi:hypothetical protein